MKFYGEHQQDEILNRDLFHDRRGGTFVDVGAFDGVEFSNTLYLERELDWRGLCIEPHPDRFADLKANRRCPCLNVAAWDKAGELDFVLPKAKGQWDKAQACEPGKRATEVYGVQTEMLGCVLEAASDRQRKTINDYAQNFGGEVAVVKVPAVRLADVFAEHKLTVIDYLTIDAENSEAQVLRGIDHQRVWINVIQFEVYHRETAADLRKTADLYEFLESQGYHYYYDLSAGRDRVFLNREQRWSAR